MDNLPDKNIKPEDIDDVIKSFGKSLPIDRKTDLMQKLETQRDRFEKRQKDQAEDITRDKGREL